MFTSEGSQCVQESEFPDMKKEGKAWDMGPPVKPPQPPRAQRNTAGLYQLETPEDWGS